MSLRLSTLGPAAVGLGLLMACAGTAHAQEVDLRIRPESLTIPTVTIGDTVEVTLSIVNRGRATATVQSIDTPDPSLQALTELPFRLDPREERIVQLRFAPREPLVLTGGGGDDDDDDEAGDQIVIGARVLTSSRTFRVPVSARALGLGFSVGLPAEPLFAGTAATVTVTPATGVRIERGSLYHRRAGTSGFASLPLEPAGTAFTVTVPGSAVLDPGLQLYVEVENSGLFARDPPAAPATFHSRTVVQPPRPRIVLLTGRLDLPAVTVGDTARADLIVRNDGDGALQISGFEAPVAQLSLSPAPPVQVAAGTQRTLTVLYAPREPATLTGSLVLVSDDPDDPRASLPVTGSAIALAFTAILPAAPLVPEQPFTVIATPAAGVRIERGSVHYRPEGATSFASVPLAPQGGGFAATVPAAAVQEPAIELYVRVENSGVVALDPAGAPATFHARAVTPVPRPRLVASTGSLSLPAVTVGDTALAGFTIRNGGTAPLHVQQVQLPPGQLRLAGGISGALQPGQRDTFTVHFEPLAPEVIQGSILVTSDDPQQPQMSIPLSARGRALEISATTDAGSLAPLGQAVRVLVTPETGVRIEQGRVHVRLAGEPAFQSLALVPEGSRWAGTIPSWQVTEPGLEWYVEVQNSGARATDPAGAPQQFRTLGVQPPTGVVAMPAPSGGDGFPAARAVQIQVHLPIGAVARSARLHFRRGGETEYREASLAVDALPLRGTVPDSLVGARGLEYWVDVTTLTSTITGPASRPAEQPYRLPVTVPSLAESVQHPARVYRLLAVPLRMPDGFTGNLADLLGPREGFGPYGSPRWLAFSYLPAETSYAELGQPGSLPQFRPAPGRAYWVVTGGPHRAGSAVAALSTPTDSSCSIVLEPGWNQVGAPFLFPVAWTDCRIDGMSAPAAQDVLVEPPVAWRPAEGYAYGVERLEPFEGYWIRNITRSSHVLRIPPRQAPPPAAGASGLLASGKTAAAPAAEGSWRVGIEARCAGRVDLHNEIAVLPGAAATWDRNDRAEPPPAPGEGLLAAFPHPGWEERAGRYAVDARGEPALLPAALAAALPGASTAALGHVWHLDVAKGFAEDGPADEVVLSFAGLETVPAGLEIWLIDRELAQAVDLRRRSEYRFLLGRKAAAASDEDCRFLLLAGEPGYAESELGDLDLPQALALRAARPNPSNPSTVIGLDLPAPSRVDLRVYDVRGAVVRTLLAGELPAGRHERAWHGQDDRGRAMASGVYFYRLQTADGFRQTRKLTLVR